MFGCTQAKDFLQYQEPDPDSVGSPRWRVRDSVDEHISDLGIINAGLVPSAGDSYRDFVLRGDNDRAALAASLSHATASRVYGRMYVPRSKGGAGWTGSPSLKMIDSAGSDPGAIAFGNLAVGLSSGGDILAAFSDGNSYLRSALAGWGQDWNDYRAITANLMPSNATSNYGRRSDILWDASGRALWAYVTAGGNSQLKVRRFSYDSGWSSPDEEIHLGTHVSEIKLLDDGYHKLAIWSSATWGVGTAAQISAGAFSSCVIENGDFRCWGLNTDNQLANGNPSGEYLSALPIAGQGLGSVEQIAMGVNFGCARDDAGRVYCWGDNSVGQLGVTGIAGSSRPVQVTGLAAHTVIDLTAGYYHACVRILTGETRCWGRNNEGQLGRGDVTPAFSATPSDVIAPLNHYTQISAGGYHTCGVTTGGNVECWGSNSNRQIGNGADTCSGAVTCPVPSTVVDTDLVGLLAGASQVAANGAHTCAIVGSNVVCWGANTEGQLGRGSTTLSGDPDFVCSSSGCGSNLSGIDEIAAGGLHSCARDGTALYCWGRNAEGQLGDNQVSGNTSTTPVVSLVLTDTTPSRMSLGYYHSCVIDAKRVTYCFGDNTYGQIGDGASGASAKRVLPTANTATVCNNDMCLLSANLDDPDRIKVRSVAKYPGGNASDVYFFGAASDSMGNVVVSYLQYDSTVGTCDSGASFCEYKLHATYRTTLSNWNTPVRLDSEFTDTAITYWQSASYGPYFPTPQVARVSPSRFEIVVPHGDWVLAYGFSPSSGWDFDAEAVLFGTAEVDDSRFGNQVHVVTDGNGNALAVVQYCMHVSEICGYVVTGYGGGQWDVSRNGSASGWVPGTLPDGYPSDEYALGFGPLCDSTEWSCAYVLPPQAHLFGSGEKLVVYAAPAENGGSKMRLQFLEYY